MEFEREPGGGFLQDFSQRSHFLAGEMAETFGVVLIRERGEFRRQAPPLRRQRKRLRAAVPEVGLAHHEVLGDEPVGELRHRSARKPHRFGDAARRRRLIAIEHPQEHPFGDGDVLGRKLAREALRDVVRHLAQPVADMVGEFRDFRHGAIPGDLLLTRKLHDYGFLVNRFPAPPSRFFSR